MATHEHRRIFISYSHRDGAQLAERLQKDLTASSFAAPLDTQRVAGDAVWTTEIEQEIDTRPKHKLAGGNLAIAHYFQKEEPK